MILTHQYLGFQLGFIEKEILKIYFTLTYIASLAFWPLHAYILKRLALESSFSRGADKTAQPVAVSMKITGKIEWWYDEPYLLRYAGPFLPFIPIFIVPLENWQPFSVKLKGWVTMAVGYWKSRPRPMPVRVKDFGRVEDHRGPPFTNAYRNKNNNNNKGVKSREAERRHALTVLHHPTKIWPWDGERDRATLKDQKEYIAEGLKKIKKTKQARLVEVRYFGSYSPASAEYQETSPSPIGVNEELMARAPPLRSNDPSSHRFQAVINELLRHEFTHHENRPLGLSSEEDEISAVQASLEYYSQPGNSEELILLLQGFEEFGIQPDPSYLVSLKIVKLLADQRGKSRLSTDKFVKRIVRAVGSSNRLKDTEWYNPDSIFSIIDPASYLPGELDLINIMFVATDVDYVGRYLLPAAILNEIDQSVLPELSKDGSSLAKFLPFAEEWLVIPAIQNSPFFAERNWKLAQISGLAAALMLGFFGYHLRNGGVDSADESLIPTHLSAAMKLFRELKDKDKPKARLVARAALAGLVISTAKGNYEKFLKDIFFTVSRRVPDFDNVVREMWAAAGIKKDFRYLRWNEGIDGQIMLSRFFDFNQKQPAGNELTLLQFLGGDKSAQDVFFKNRRQWPDERIKSMIDTLARVIGERQPAPLSGARSRQEREAGNVGLSVAIMLVFVVGMVVGSALLVFASRIRLERDVSPARIEADDKTVEKTHLSEEINFHTELRRKSNFSANPDVTNFNGNGMNVNGDISTVAHHTVRDLSLRVIDSQSICNAGVKDGSARPTVNKGICSVNSSRPSENNINDRKVSTFEFLIRKSDPFHKTNSWVKKSGRGRHNIMGINLGYLALAFSISSSPVKISPLQRMTVLPPYFITSFSKFLLKNSSLSTIFILFLVFAFIVVSPFVSNVARSQKDVKAAAAVTIFTLLCAGCSIPESQTRAAPLSQTSQTSPASPAPPAAQSREIIRRPESDQRDSVQRRIKIIDDKIRILEETRLTYQNSLAAFASRLAAVISIRYQITAVLVEANQYWPGPGFGSIQLLSSLIQSSSLRLPDRERNAVEEIHMRTARLTEVLSAVVREGSNRNLVPTRLFRDPAAVALAVLGAKGSPDLVKAIFDDMQRPNASQADVRLDEAILETMYFDMPALADFERLIEDLKAKEDWKIFTVLKEIHALLAILNKDQISGKLIIFVRDLNEHSLMAVRRAAADLMYSLYVKKTGHNPGQIYGRTKDQEKEEDEKNRESGAVLGEGLQVVLLLVRANPITNRAGRKLMAFAMVVLAMPLVSAGEGNWQMIVLAAVLIGLGALLWRIRENILATLRHSKITRNLISTLEGLFIASAALWAAAVFLPLQLPADFEKFTLTALQFWALFSIMTFIALVILNYFFGAIQLDGSVIKREWVDSVRTSLMTGSSLLGVIFIALAVMTNGQLSQVLLGVGVLGAIAPRLWLNHSSHPQTITAGEHLNYPRARSLRGLVFWLTLEFTAFLVAVLGLGPLLMMSRTSSQHIMLTIIFFPGNYFRFDCPGSA